MKRIYFLLSIILIVCAFSSDVVSQNVHFTNNNIIPTLFNPAQTGAFTGTYRAGVIARNQWAPSTPNPYNSAGLFIDSPIVYGLSKQHWVGVGATLFYDKTGEAAQTWSGFYPGVSYHIGLDKKFRNIFTIGVQYGFANRGYSTDAITEGSILNSSIADPDLQRIIGASAGENISIGSSHLNIGLLYKSALDKYSKFEIGAAYLNVLNSDLTFNAGGELADTSKTAAPVGVIAEGGRLNVHTKYRRAASKQMIWEPAAFVSIMPGATNINIQLRNEYLIKKGGDLSIITGLGMRFGDAAQLLLGANYKDYQFAYSYDHTIADHGGYDAAHEIGVTKIFIVNKKPKVKPIIFCPRL